LPIILLINFLSSNLKKEALEAYQATGTLTDEVKFIKYF
jgi:hypothetical protein